MDDVRATPSRVGAPVAVFWAAAAGADRVDSAAGLAPDEVARADRYRSSAARAEFVTGARLLRAVAASLDPAGGSPLGVRVDRTCVDCGEQHGRPRLPDRPDAHLSVTHSGGMVGLAVSVGARVGLDVEPLAESVDAGLIESVCTAAEQRSLRAARPSERAAGFTRLWCRKEAVLKAIGVGLAVPAARVDVSASRAIPADDVLRSLSAGVTARWIDPTSGSWLPLVGPGRGFAEALFALDPARVVAETVVAELDHPLEGLDRDGIVGLFTVPPRE